MRWFNVPAPVIGPPRWLWALVLILLSALAGGLLGIRLCGNEYLAQIATLKLQHEQQERQAVQAAYEREAQARTAGNQAQARLAEQLQANAALTEERNHAIAHATTGRPCLGGRALRVLDGAPGLRVAGLPGAAAWPAGEDAATAAHTNASGPSGAGLVATDTAIATWALAAGAQYEQCRSRLGALIDYASATTAPAAQ